MQMDAGLDTGDMLLVESTTITPEDSTATLHDRLAALGAKLIVEVLDIAAWGRLSPTPQPATGATYARKIEKGEGAINWSESAARIERRLRAFDPYPGASSQLGAETIKLWRGAVVDGCGAPGEVLVAGDAGIVVACGDRALQITELQRPGGRRASAAQFLARHRITPGVRFLQPD